MVVDNKMHHSVPLAELGYFAQPTEQRRSLATTAIPYVVLNSVAQGAQELGGRSLAQLVDAQHASDSLQHQSHDLHGFSDATLLRTQIVSSLVPLLQRTLSLELQTYLLKRLIVVPTLIPLLDSPALSSSSATRESFLVCLKAVVPASVELPGRLNWCSFALFKAQAECVGLDSNRRLDKLAAAASRQSALDLSRQPTSLTESSQSPHGSVLDGEEPGDVAGARRPVATPPSFPPSRPVQIPAYDPDWVISLLKPSAPIQVQAWDWMDTPRKSREAGKTS